MFGNLMRSLKWSASLCCPPCHTVTLLATIILIAVTEMTSIPDSSVEMEFGHYPYFYCKISNAVLAFNDTAGTFQYRSAHDLHSKCNDANQVWDIENSDTLTLDQCDLTFEQGHAFTIFYWFGHSNYYHLHYDMMIPLYQEIYHRLPQHQHGSMAFMPTVETARLKKLKWDTDAFQGKNMDKFWMQLTKTISRNQSHLPLDQHLVKEDRKLCFKKLHLGTSSVKYTDPEVIRGFSAWVKGQLGVKSEQMTEHRIGIISRSNRRLILNEPELAESLRSLAEVDLLNFVGMTFKEQVELMQQYSVLAGVNGAGLMNALFLPPHGVCIQMVPYEAQLNVVQYGNLLKSRGPYLEWHNKHENLSRLKYDDKNRNRPDTIVHLEEFKNVVRQALELSDLMLKRAHREEL